MQWQVWKIRPDPSSPSQAAAPDPTLYLHRESGLLTGWVPLTGPLRLPVLVTLSRSLSAHECLWCTWLWAQALPPKLW